MKRTISILALAAPLATVALSLGASPALAEPAGPAIDTIASSPPGPVNPHVPPLDEKDAPPVDPEPDPEVPDEFTNPQPCPTHGSCGEDTPDDKKVPNDEDEPGEDDSTDDEIEKPTRIDAGTVTSDTGAADDLAWLLTGGLVIAMTGAAYAVRRRERERTTELIDLGA